MPHTKYCVTDMTYIPKGVHIKEHHESQDEVLHIEC
jgi:hypothetical protein